VVSSNILFWRESDYFATIAELKPLLHTWSLAVEEQYYVFFPLFLMVMWRFGKRWVLVLLAVAFTVSLCMAQWGVSTKPKATFYLLPTRGWELLVGAFCAFYISKKDRISLGKGLSEIGGIVGMILICYSVFVFSKGTPFPSIYALVPTLGTALIILCANDSTVVGRLLGFRVFVGIGLISYSAYLWHHPLMAFAKHRSIHEPSGEVFGALAVLSIILAYFSWKYVEQPFRDKKKFSRKFIFTTGFVPSVFVIIVGLIGYMGNGFPLRFEKMQKETFGNQFASHNLRENCDNDYDEKGWGIQFCTLGNKDLHVNPTIAVFGDSHANALNPVFDALGKEKNKNYVHIGLGGCPPLIGVDVVRGNYELGVCENLDEQEYEFVRKNNIKKVVLVSRWSLYTDGEYSGLLGGYFLISNGNTSHSKAISRQVFEEGLRRTIQAYKGLGAEVYILLQIPQQMVDAKRLYTKLIQFTPSKNEDVDLILGEASVSFNRHLNLQEYNRRVIDRIAKDEGAIVLNPDLFFCDVYSCSIGSSQASFYKDSDHVNTIGAMKLAPLFVELFE